MDNHTERDANGGEIEGCDTAAEWPFSEDRDSVTVTLEEPLLRTNTARISTTSQLAIVGSNVCPIESLDYEYVYYVLLIFSILVASYFLCVCDHVVDDVIFGGFFGYLRYVLISIIILLFCVDSDCILFFSFCIWNDLVSYVVPNA